MSIVFLKCTFKLAIQFFFFKFLRSKHFLLCISFVYCNRSEVWMTLVEFDCWMETDINQLQEEWLPDTNYTLDTRL